MTVVDIPTVAVFGVLCAAVHWIIARATITKWFWSRTSGWLAELLACPACSGWWIGLVLAASVPIRPIRHFGSSAPVVEILLAGVLATFLTPVLEGIMLWGLRESAIEEAVEPANDDS